eukprot:1146290-Lingulodinium_polyedra.AAC.1
MRDWAAVQATQEGKPRAARFVPIGPPADPWPCGCAAAQSRRWAPARARPQTGGRHPPWLPTSPRAMG